VALAGVVCLTPWGGRPRSDQLEILIFPEVTSSQTFLPLSKSFFETFE